MTRTIGITGGSGSGKTTMARALAKALAPHSVALIGEDDYYRCSTSYPNFDPLTHNFDEPAAKDDALLCQHLAMARDGLPFDKPLYDLKTHKRRPETERIEPADFVIVEGLHVLATDDLCAAFDFALFMDAAESLRLGRRMIRDVEERARTPQSVLKQWFEHVQPMHVLHVEPQAERADLVMPSSYEDKLSDVDVQGIELAAALLEANKRQTG